MQYYKFELFWDKNILGSPPQKRIAQFFATKPVFFYLKNQKKKLFAHFDIPNLLTAEV